MSLEKQQYRDGRYTTMTVAGQTTCDDVLIEGDLIRRNENKFNGYYEYPHMTYSISSSDLLEPVDVGLAEDLAETSASNLS